MLRAANNAGVKHLLIPATQRSGWQNLLDVCATDARLYPALGLHPMLLNAHAKQDLPALDAWVTKYHPVAIGEIGLDYVDKTLDKTQQQSLFAAQLEIAGQHQLPVVLHVRKAHDVALDTLKRYRVPGGFCHAFNGSLQQAGQYLALGFKLGFGGMLTYPNASKLRKLATGLPLSAIVLETDAPGMVGLAHRHQRNSPAYLPEAARVLAWLRGVSVDEVASITTENGLQIIAAKMLASVVPAE